MLFFQPPQRKDLENLFNENLGSLFWKTMKNNFGTNC